MRQRCDAAAVVACGSGGGAAGLGALLSSLSRSRECHDGERWHPRTVRRPHGFPVVPAPPRWSNPAPQRPNHTAPALLVVLAHGRGRLELHDPGAPLAAGPQVQVIVEHLVLVCLVQGPSCCWYRLWGLQGPVLALVCLCRRHSLTLAPWARRVWDESRVFGVAGEDQAATKRATGRPSQTLRESASRSACSPAVYALLPNSNPPAGFSQPPPSHPGLDAKARKRRANCSSKRALIAISHITLCVCNRSPRAASALPALN